MSEKKFTTASSGGILGEVTEDWNIVLPPGATFYWRMKPPKSKVQHVTTSMTSDNKVDTEATTKSLDAEYLKGRMATTNQLTPPPRLEPMNYPYMTAGNVGAIEAESVNPSTHVNIKDEHHWTESPMTARGEVPVLSLKEYDVLQNAGINQILQNMGVTLGNVDAASQNLKQLMDFFSLFTEDKGLEKAKDIIQKKLDAFEATEGSVARATDEVLGSADPMQVYKGLYSRNPTGFKYSFPYMEDMQFKTSGGFTEDPHSMGGFMGMMNDATEFTAKFSGALAGRFTEPGRYIEKPKNFAFDGRQKSYTVKFPLFNTKSYNEIIKNWQFLFLITYQNTPGRVTKDVIQPPVQYEAYISGSWYSKYTSITDMTVNFKGARREMNIPVPFLDRTQTNGDDWLLQKRMIRTVIPDAYEVSITLTEIFAETQNTLYHMLAQSTDAKIITGVMQEYSDNNDISNQFAPGMNDANMNMDTRIMDNFGGMNA